MTRPITFYSEMTGLVDKRTTADFICLGLRVAFNTLPHQILIGKLIKYGLDEQTVR